MTGRLARHLGPAAPFVEAAVAVAFAQGATAALVGGGVRDLLLRRPCTDVDLVFEGDAIAIGEALQTAHGGALRRHAAFGTATWQPLADLPHIDLVTARAERYPTPGALPLVCPADLAADLARRDFSINAMALRLHPTAAPRLVDPFDGAADLRARRVRALHPLSFADDPTRAFRAARYCARLGATLTADTAAQLPQARDHLAALSLERLGQELWRLAAEPDPIAAFDALHGMALLGRLHPAWAPCRGRRLAPAAPDPAQSFLRLAAALPAADRPALQRLDPGDRFAQRRWNTGPERVLAAILALRRATRPARAARALQSLDPVERRWAAARAAAAARWIAWWEQQGAHQRSAIDGRQLLAAGLSPGPKLRRALEAAQDAAWNGAPAADQLRRALQAAGA